MELIVQKLSITDKQLSELTQIRLSLLKEAFFTINPLVLSTLEALKKRGNKLVLISNCDVMDVYYFNGSPLKNLFDVVVFSYEVGCLKPDKAIYETALKLSHTDHSDALFFGDGSSNELSGAKNAGMTPYKVNCIYNNEMVPKEDYYGIISSYEELLTL